MPRSLARAVSQWPSCLPHGAKLARLGRLAAARAGGESESGAGRGEGGGGASAVFDTFLLLLRGASHKRRGAAVRVSGVSGVCRPSAPAELCQSRSRSERAAKRAETERERLVEAGRGRRYLRLPSRVQVHLQAAPLPVTCSELRRTRHVHLGRTARRLASSPPLYH